MSEQTLQTLKEGYLNLYKTAIVSSFRYQEIDRVIDKLLIPNNSRYLAVQSILGVPWYVTACIHYRESGCDFLTHLHNGDSLFIRTIHEPKGRPVRGVPPFSWEESATDAINYQGLDKVKDWSIPSMLYHLEKYNGFGYFIKEINSPYLWAGTNFYSKGKFIGDGIFNATFVDRQIGCATLIKRMQERKILSF